MTIRNMTSSEIGILWSQYIENSMSLQILKYFNEIVEDEEIQNIIKETLNFTEKVKQEIEHLFEKEQIPIPDGFSSQDVNLEAPRLYTDTFMLTFIEMIGKAGTLAYSLSQSVSTRSDIRNFFSTCLVKVSTLLNQSIDIGLSKGSYVSPPSITKPEEIEYINGRAYFTSGLNPFSKRTLNSIEILHLFENLKSNSIGSLICTSFAQTTDNKEIKKYFLDGKNIASKHVKIFSDKLAQSDIQAPASSDNGVTNSTTRAFSDKLMLFFLSILTASGQGNYSTASSASMRFDLIADYQRLSAEVALFAKDGFAIMLKHHWLEEPPQAAKRKELIESK